METKKNIVIDGKFTKIFYSDEFVTLNGIFIEFPLQSKIENNLKNIFYFNQNHNQFMLKKITEIERNIIEKFILENNISKNMVLGLNNQLNTGKIKLYNEKSIQNMEYSNSKIILKISGIWETDNEIGIAFKFIEMYEK